MEPPEPSPHAKAPQASPTLGARRRPEEPGCWHTALQSQSWHPRHAELSFGASAPPQTRTSTARAGIPSDVSHLHSHLLIYRAEAGRRTAGDQQDSSLPAQIPFSLCICRKQ